MIASAPRILFAAFVLLTAAPVFSRADGPTPFPDPKDESAWPGNGPIRVFPWMVDNRNYFWSRRNTDQGTIVFVGDSLTGNWKLGDMKAAMPGLSLSNRGIGGDGTRGVLFRLKEDVLDLNPQALVLLIGTNDLSAKAPVQVIADNVTLILDQAREFNKDMPIVLCLLPPRASEAAPIDPQKLAELNARLAAIGENYQKLVVLDLFTALATPEGNPDPKYFGKDLLHIASGGYQKWAELLKPAFEKLGIN
jgi:lysophospholipase L1-like esterase